MKSNISTFVAAAGIVLLLMNGCATQASLQKEITALQDQVSAIKADIAMLQSSDTEQNEELSVLSDTIQDAVVRVQQLREMAEGRFLYEKTISADEVRFEFDRSELSQTAKEALDAFALKLKGQNKNCYIEIQGHTDNIGSEKYNFQLGLSRARAVMSYLHLQHEIPLNRMNTFSYGASQPIADNKIQAERAKNRRVTLIVMT
jgi:outer membrane protein OmpA-like peptidoglycan-associated protein